MNYRELSILFEKLVKNECTEKEADEVLKLLADRSYDSMFRQLVEEQFQQTGEGLIFYEAQEEALNLKLTTILNSNLPPKKAGKKYFQGLQKWYIAATVLLFLATGAYVLKKNTSTDVVANNRQQKISFGGNKATLTLSNGKKIDLEDAANGAIAAQSNFTIKKTSEGVVVYQANAASKTAGSAIAKPLFNTITTPNGGQYEVILPDGSKVWLNAASSIKFPTQFAANERLVELTGEAYFEVVKVFNPQKKVIKPERLPFVVLSGRQRIQVLGTRFNVNDYHEENTVKTTLLEGSVKVNTLIDNDQHQSISTAMLRPGQQSDLDGGHFNVSAADTASAIAWKDGFFQFDNEDIHVVMRKISRWYNVDVEYRGDMRGKGFSGVISKYSNVSEVLKMLQLTGSVSFTINNRKITVF
ncbi:FecR family protein [Mucilaginibacter sp. FT3.2]|uniref:FecR family protein n=1 Tax=Mucilaginibacter sp. FT3.2 TaxID=2723090 RepID=UPI00161605B6|nr:FecR family protein [Mucilaginibacter sp. FT3.2]MBB6234521.1 ferric-dicitrate binding protein FerR (iron transport regulator) [Mucilaginibacter sp. FT3.2]